MYGSFAHKAESQCDLVVGCVALCDDTKEGVNQVHTKSSKRFRRKDAEMKPTVRRKPKSALPSCYCIAWSIWLEETQHRLLEWVGKRNPFDSVWFDMKNEQEGKWPECRKGNPESRRWLAFLAPLATNNTSGTPWSPLKPSPAQLAFASRHRFMLSLTLALACSYLFIANHALDTELVVQSPGSFSTCPRKNTINTFVLTAASLLPVKFHTFGPFDGPQGPVIDAENRQE